MGVDISSTSVKLIQLSVKNSKYQVEAYGVLPLAENDVVDKTIMDSEHVAEVLERVYNLANPNIKQVALAVPAVAAITKIIQMDAEMGDDEREVQIRLDAEQYIPYPLDEVSLDFEVLSFNEKNPAKVDVLLVATRTENVDKRVEVAELAGLKTRVMDVESYALERSYALLAGSLPIGANIVAVLDVGHTQTTLIVLDQGQVVYSREQSFGGKQLTLDVQQRYGLSFAEAGFAKKERNLPDDFEPEVLYPFMEAIAQQAARSLQLFFSSSQYSEIDHLLLAGGSANITGFPKLLQEALGYRVTIANPFLRMSYAPQVDVRKLENDAPSLLVASGLALRSFD
ncbi:pilus assembly protein PilM [Acinetobacter qingfengensis]|nr:pilus assembly protein PilM [Acinetobacter qingfengensis]